MKQGLRQPTDGPFDQPLLERIQRLVQGNAGIVINDAKAEMVRARLSKCMAATGHSNIAAYLDHVEGSECADALDDLISAMTTNVTHFFRESHHFEALGREVAPAWKAEPGLRSVWSAGCSTGQEPYSIAMTLSEAGLTRDGVRVLATDIDRAVLSRAAAGVYAQKDVSSICPALLGRYFTADDAHWKVCAALRRMVTFRYLNLNDGWPFVGRFDAIFCRNVAIYFDGPTQLRLWRRLLATLKPGGRLFVGHSERLPDAFTRSGIVRLGHTMYAKPEDSPVRT